MAANVINSPLAIQMSVFVVRAFIYALARAIMSRKAAKYAKEDSKFGRPETQYSGLWLGIPLHPWRLGVRKGLFNGILTGSTI